MNWERKPFYWADKDVKFLAEGGFGKVYLVTNPEGEQWVVKQYSQLSDDIRKDIATLQALQREGITRRCGVPEIRSVALIPAYGRRGKLVPSVEQELVRGQNLLEVLRKQTLEPMQILAIAEDLLETLDCLHRAGLAHRDIKLENVIWDDQHARLIDYDFTCQGTPPELRGLQQCDLSPPAGTVSYAAPELYRSLVDRQPNSRGSERKSDIWALGILLWELLTDTTIEHPNSLAQVEAIPAQLSNTESNQRLIDSAPLFSLIRSMLRIDPAERPSARQLLDLLR